MNKRIHLSENRTRTLSSSLIVIEKYFSKLEGMLSKQNNTCSDELLKDIDDELITSNIVAIQVTRRYICERGGTAV
jgi:hypothetical protein